jgi:predicted component of type VI protein secretion system
LAFAGLLSQRTRPACNIEAVLSAYFEEELGADARVVVEENVFQWAYLASEDQNALGQANSRIGGSNAFIAGTRVPDRMGAFRVHLGPMALDPFARFLPNQPSHRTLIQLGRLVSPFGTEFDLDLKLVAEEVPDWNLTAAEGGSLGRLGWTTWAQSKPRSEPGVVRLRPATTSAG